jgi:predicted Zn finger-like uncharacterized protein
MHCPHCEQKIRVREEYLGKRVKCPGCGERFIVDPETEEPMVVGQVDEADDEERPIRKRRAAPPPEEDQEEERPRRRRPAREEQEEAEDTRVTRKRPPAAEDEVEDEEHYDADEEEAQRRKAKRSKAGWRKVRTGLTLILIAFFVVVGLFVVSLVGAGAAGAMAGPKGDFSASRRIGAIGAIIGCIVGFGLSLTGLGFCIAVPVKTGAKPFAIGALALGILAFLLWSIRTAFEAANGTLGGEQNAQAGVSTELIMSAMFLGLLFFYSLVFLLFLRATALAVRREGTATLIVIDLVVLVIWGLMLAVVVAVIGAAPLAGAAPPGAAAAGVGFALLGASCVLIVAVLAFAILSVIAVAKVRAAVSEKAGR